MEIPLITSVQLQSINQDDITIEDIQSNHQQLLNNNCGINSTAEIIDALGGIDHILQTCLSHPNASNLSKSQLNHINNIVISSNQMVSNTKDQESIDIDPVFIVSSNNTFLHRIVNTDIASKISDIILGRIVNIIIMILGLILTICTTMNYVRKVDVNADKFLFVFSGICYSIFIPYQILLLFSLNRTITLQTGKTFDFWLKFVYYIIFCICLSIYNFDRNTSAIIITNNVFGYFNGSLFVMLYGLLDGLQISFRFKITVLVLGSIYVTIWAFSWTFLVNDYIETFHLFGYNVDLDVLAMIASSLRIVAVFMWKQTFWSIFGGNKSTMISRTATIHWL